MAEETGLTCCEDRLVKRFFGWLQSLPLGKQRASWQSIVNELTSFSPTMTCTVRPFGTTCARSLSFTFFVAAVLSGATRKFSSTSGLNLPPARSFERSSFRRSIAVAMSASRAEKSDGSSTAEPLDWDLDSSRAALAPFLRRVGVFEKDRAVLLWRRHCLGCC